MGSRHPAYPQGPGHWKRALALSLAVNPCSGERTSPFANGLWFAGTFRRAGRETLPSCPCGFFCGRSFNKAHRDASQIITKAAVSAPRDAKTISGLLALGDGQMCEEVPNSLFFPYITGNIP